MLGTRERPTVLPWRLELQAKASGAALGLLRCPSRAALGTQPPPLMPLVTAIRGYVQVPVGGLGGRGATQVRLAKGAQKVLVREGCWFWGANSRKRVGQRCSVSGLMPPEEGEEGEA